MQKVQQWDLKKGKHIYSLQALKIFYSMHPTTEYTGSVTQVITLTAEHPRIILKCHHNITFNINNIKLAASSWPEE